MLSLPMEIESAAKGCAGISKPQGESAMLSLATIAVLVLCGFGLVDGDATVPRIKDLPLARLHAAKEAVTIPTQDKPAVGRVQLPSFPKQGDGVLCLRFEACWSIRRPVDGIRISV